MAEDEIQDETEDGPGWVRRLEEHRAAKDEFFATDAGSPIPEAERRDFEGLSYFPPDDAFRLDGRFERFEEPETVSLGATSGPDMEFERVGSVGITLDGELHVLRAYRAPGVTDVLVPFRDGTNGTETWQHGRYLSLVVSSERGPTELVVDFNLAYHPFCIYNADVVSAIPPTENELPVPIRAGERL